jgi:hypothetical protein
MNYLLALMDAVNYSTRTGSNQQLADTATAENTVENEQAIYSHWNSQIVQASGKVQAWAQLLASDPDNKTYQNELAGAQAAFQQAQIQSQTATQQADSATQAAQTQTGQDSSTMQQKIQLESAVMQVLQSLSSALAH